MKFTIIRFLKSTFIRLRLRVVFEPFSGAMLHLAFMPGFPNAGFASGVSLNWWMRENTDTESFFMALRPLQDFLTIFALIKKTFNTKNNIPIIKDITDRYLPGIISTNTSRFLKTFNAKIRIVVMLAADLFTGTIIL
ncbi:MAG: hypothetical protein ABIO55_02375 [Ginsengibacter sp.]